METSANIQVVGTKKTLFHRAEVRKNREIIERTFSETGKSSSGFSGIGVWLETFYGNSALAYGTETLGFHFSL